MKYLRIFSQTIPFDIQGVYINKKEIGNICKAPEKIKILICRFVVFNLQTDEKIIPLFSTGFPVLS